MRKGDRADRGVRVWFETVDDADLYTSVLVIGELRRGVELVRRRDGLSAQALEQWLLRTVGIFGHHILPVDAPIAERWGRLNVPVPVPTVDGLLAATAIEHGLTLVTRNTRDVATTGATMLDPFDQA